MNKKRTLALLALICGLTASQAQTLVPTDANPENQLSLNGTWQFRLDGKGPAGTIRVPGNWDMQGFAQPVYGNGRTSAFGKDHPAHQGVYERTFTLPDHWRGRNVWIGFDGVENGYTLYVNGDSIGMFHSAFNRSMFDITPAVRFGKPNQLKVVVTQTGVPYWEFDTNDDWIFGGISRDVTLYALPQQHISNLDVGYELADRKARVKLDMAATTGKHAWRVELCDAGGKVVYANARVKADSLTFDIEGPQLWSAENPYLYRLSVSLLRGKQVVETVERRVGVRTVAWQGGVFRINGVAVKLKGVNHHDESAVNGRAISEDEMLQDLRMMKAANINAIRCSHYPPSPHFMDMLDSLGFYAICEVPFGFGDKYLKRPTTLPELKRRAWLTVQQHKLRPSVVIWSVGNENPVTDNGLRTAHYVSRLDPSRPNVFPSTHRPFLQLMQLDDDSLTMLSCHYPLSSELRKWAPEMRVPLVNTECAHALGLDFGQIEDLVGEWYGHEHLAGGCVWEWADQGLLRSDRHIGSRYEPTEEVWTTPDTYYDMKGILGTDGIVYPNRFPQTDYWEVRGVYAPVVIGMDKDGICTVENRYDFTPLSALTCKVEYFEGGQRKATMDTRCDVAPHERKRIDLFASLPRHELGYAVVSFANGRGDELYRQSFRLDGGRGQVRPDSIGNTATVRATANDMKAWMEQNVRLRMGRKATLSSVATLAGEQGKKHHLWSKHLLKPSWVKVLQGKGDGKELVFGVRFDCDSTHFAEGTIGVTQEGNGFLLKYDLRAHGDGEATETGLTLLTGLESKDATLRYLGRGPYACMPGRSLLAWYGCHELRGDDIYFAGNRMDVDVAMLADDGGRGFVVVPVEGSNIGVERDTTGAVLMSHAVSVASPFNKNIWPKGTVATDGLAIGGSFRLYPVEGEPTPYLRRLLFTNVPVKAMEQPFFNSYDQ